MVVSCCVPFSLFISTVLRTQNYMEKIIILAAESFQFREGLLKFKDLLGQKVNDLKSLDQHRDLIKFITKAPGSLCMIFFPPDELHIIVQYLVQFQTLDNVSNEIAAKMKEWSTIQLRHIATMPQLITKKFPFMAKCNMSNFLTQLILKMENEFFMLSQERNNVNLVEKITYQAGKAFIRNDPHNRDVIESCLRILNQIQKIESNSSFAQELSSELFQLYQSEPSSVDASTVELLLTLYPVALEHELIRFLSCCYNEDQMTNSSQIEALVKSSDVVKMCAQNALLFRKVLEIMTEVWFKCEGHPSVSQILSSFVSAVELQCTDKNIIALFPYNLQHLAMLLSISPAYYSLVRSSLDLWRRMLSAVHENICSKKEIVMMLVIYSKWYYKLLLDVRDSANEDAVQLIELLWSCKDRDSIAKHVEIILNNLAHCV